MWNKLSFGTSKLSAGASTQTTSRATIKALQPLRVSSGAGVGNVSWEEVFIFLSFRTAALHSEDALRTFLYEDDDEHQHSNLGQHGAGPAFKKLVQKTQTQGGVHSAGELSDAAQHHHHERVHDVALAQVRPHVADLTESATCQSRDART